MGLGTPTGFDAAGEAAAFVRFCYQRRRVGWPELYDEMCSVASRRLYQGWGPAELSEHGIGFRIEEVGRLAELVRMVVGEDPGRHAVPYRGGTRRALDWRAPQAGSAPAQSSTSARAPERAGGEPDPAPATAS